MRRSTLAALAVLVVLFGTANGIKCYGSTANGDVDTSTDWPCAADTADRPTTSYGKCVISNSPEIAGDGTGKVGAGCGGTASCVCSGPKEKCDSLWRCKTCDTDRCNTKDILPAAPTAVTATTTTGALKCYVTDSSTTSGEKTYDCPAAIASTKNACYTLSHNGAALKGCSALSEGCPALIKAYPGASCTECNTNLCNTGNTGGAAGLYAGAWTSVLASVVLLVNVHF